MLSVNFETSRRKHPELVPTFEKIQRWSEANPREDFLDLTSLARLATNKEAGALSLALSHLVEDGVLRESVAVIAPTNYAFALDENGSRMGFWDTEEEIPKD